MEQSVKRHPVFTIQGLRCAIVFLCAFAFTGSTDEEFDWKKAALEVKDYAFTTAYIDSIRSLYDVVEPSTPLRHVQAGSFRDGETLVYEVSWGVFRAGYVVLTTEPDLSNGTLRLGAKALSNNFVSAFYRMRDYVISTVDEKGMYPLIFEQHLREGKKYKADGWILYDHLKGKVHVQEKKFRTLDTPPFVHDYISVLYYARTLSYTPGDTFTLNLFIHSKVHPIFFKCKGRKPVQVDCGTFNCIGLEPTLMGEGRAFNKKDKMEVWLTDDDKRVPIFIKSKIKVGSVVAKLVWKSNPEDIGLKSPAVEAHR